MLALVMDQIRNNSGRWRRAKWAVADNHQEMWRGAVNMRRGIQRRPSKSKKKFRDDKLPPEVTLAALEDA